MVSAVVAGMQNVKAKDVLSIDMTGIEQRALDYMVLCTANSGVQVRAIAEEVESEVKKETGVSPIAVQGVDNAQWVALDYGFLMVHVMMPDMRVFYDIDSLWSDAKLTRYEDII